MRKTVNKRLVAHFECFGLRRLRNSLRLFIQTKYRRKGEASGLACTTWLSNSLSVVVRPFSFTFFDVFVFSRYFALESLVRFLLFYIVSYICALKSRIATILIFCKKEFIIVFHFLEFKPYYCRNFNFDKSL